MNWIINLFKPKKLVTIELEKNNSGKWFWKMVAENNEILCHSQPYSSKQAAKKTAYSFKDKKFIVMEER